MPDKFIVPQFIENEDKILGPVTVRQFVLSLITVGVVFLEYRLLKLPYFIFATVITVPIGGVFGFVKVNGQPFHIFFLNFMQTMLRPGLRVWDKAPKEDELRLLIKPQTIAEKDPNDMPRRKPKPGSSRLRDLSLTVNTGGVYDADTDNSS
ncbi:MAG: PrgI family protein [Candidatus Uhrbacteria bacterium]|nr:PrgI family protein [Candidatus Uhrbacteria bacterium]